jgi:hypothetical protein
MLNHSTVALLLSERITLRARRAVMSDTLVGCDWCCGGGDDEAEFIAERLAEIEALIGPDRLIFAKQATVAASLGCNVALVARDGSYIIGTVMGDARQDETPDVVGISFGPHWNVAPATPDGAALLSLI